LIGFPRASTITAQREIVQMKVFAVGRFAKRLSAGERARILLPEAADTLKLYLDGKIDQFWFCLDEPGVIFLMNGSVEEAREALDRLPLVEGGFLDFELTPVGPLAPLGVLIRGE
jgi:hypothetical protein